MKHGQPLSDPKGLGGTSHLILDQETEVRRLAHEGPEATYVEQEPREKTQMSLSGLRPTCIEADRVISTFSFDPASSRAHRIPIEGG